jgi:flagellar basal-body rod protein FlgB
MMKINVLNKTLVPLLKMSLNAYTTRQQAIAENISNQDTPGYKPIKVSFEENLQDILTKKKLIGRKSNPRHLDIGKSLVEKKGLMEELSQQNTEVNLEEEMAELAKNQIRFEFASKMLAGTYESIRSSILGRAR